MQVIEVNTPSLLSSFLDFNAIANKSNPNYIRPLDKEVEAVFNPSKNNLYK